MKELAEQIDSHMEVIDLDNPTSLVELYYFEYGLKTWSIYTAFGDKKKYF